jgi:hypothetical protein
MSKSKSSSGSNKHEHKFARWALFVTALTLVVTFALGMLSNRLLKTIPIWGALLIQFVLVALGVVCDLFGIAVAIADMPPFLSMASKQVPGAEQGMWLLKNAERVSNIFNDVFGDIFGVLSGATGIAIVVVIIRDFKSLSTVQELVDIGMTSVVAALLVGGKASAKAYAMRNSKKIVLGLGRLLGFFTLKRKGPGRKQQRNA